MDNGHVQYLRSVLIWAPISRKRRLRLITASAAKELGTMIHGSVENMVRSLDARRNLDVSEKQFCMCKWLNNLSNPLCTLPIMGNFPIDGFCGMASIPFPFLLPNDVLNNGLSCRRCERTYERYRFDALAANVVLMEMNYRARSRAGFLNHIRHCRGARELISARLKEND